MTIHIAAGEYLSCTSSACALSRGFEVSSIDGRRRLTSSALASVYFPNISSSLESTTIFPVHSIYRLKKPTTMVKVAENRVVDLDIFPGTEEEKLKAQADALMYVLSTA